MHIQYHESSNHDLVTGLETMYARIGKYKPLVEALNPETEEEKGPLPLLERLRQARTDSVPVDSDGIVLISLQRAMESCVADEAWEQAAHMLSSNAVEDQLTAIELSEKARAEAGRAVNINALT